MNTISAEEKTVIEQLIEGLEADSRFLNGENDCEIDRAVGKYLMSIVNDLRDKYLPMEKEQLAKAKSAPQTEEAFQPISEEVEDVEALAEKKYPYLENDLYSPDDEDYKEMLWHIDKLREAFIAGYKSAAHKAVENKSGLRWVKKGKGLPDEGKVVICRYRPDGCGLSWEVIKGDRKKTEFLCKDFQKFEVEWLDESEEVENKSSEEVVPVTNDELKSGDYVVATKYEDGDPKDHFCVGFFTNMTWHNRYNIVDDNRQLFRGNGFRKVKKISQEVGAKIVSHIKEIEQGENSVWWWVNQFENGQVVPVECYVPKMERLIPLLDALKAVDEWLNSEDTWTSGERIECKSGSLLSRFLKKTTITTIQ